MDDFEKSKYVLIGAGAVVAGIILGQSETVKTLFQMWDKSELRKAMSTDVASVIHKINNPK